MLDGRVGERARTAARAPRRAAGRGRRRRGRQPLGAARRRAARDRRDRLAHRLGAERRLARRRARRHGRARDAAHARGGRGRRPARWRSSTGPTRRARASAAASSAPPRPAGTLDPDAVRDLRDAERHAPRGRARARTASTSTAPPRPARACATCAPTSSCTSSRGRCSRASALPVGTVLGTVGVERHRVIFRGQAAHAGSTPMTHRRDSFLAAARFALAVRDAAIRHDGGVDDGRRRLQAGRRHGDRRRDGAAARPAPPRRGRARRPARGVEGARPRRPRRPSAAPSSGSRSGRSSRSRSTPS